MFALIDTHGVGYVLRPLAAEDAAPLSAFFAGLSKATLGRFAPHPITYEHVESLCASRTSDSPNEYWIIVSRAGAIVGYCLLLQTRSSAELTRMREAGVDVGESRWLRFAPCLAEDYRGRGLAEALMAPLFQVARAEGVAGLVLMGGVQVDNAAALNFYQKHHFAPAGRFHWQSKDNIDMYLPMVDWMPRALPNNLVYCINGDVSVEQFREVLVESGLAERRPAEDLDCLRGMIENSNLVISVWRNDRLVGIARSMTDFHFACYLSDLAVSCQLQKSGLGKSMMAATRAMLGPRCKLILLAAPAAADYYRPLGFAHNDRCWVSEDT